MLLATLDAQAGYDKLRRQTPETAIAVSGGSCPMASQSLVGVARRRHGCRKTISCNPILQLNDDVLVSVVRPTRHPIAALARDLNLAATLARLLIYGE